MVGLADDIGTIADRLASGFTTMGDALDASLDGERDGEVGDGKQRQAATA
jgi:hypothetical protein